MIPKECRRLAEVDFPIAVVSKHAAKEKSIRHGHPSTLHLWWARRPLAACRAMLLGLLLPDPCDPNCPADFKKKARELLPKVQGAPGAKDKDLRDALLGFIGECANWELSSDKSHIDVGRKLIGAAHPDETPLIVDPFAGGGSIPLEALRLGCDAFASDLNPVASLILKVMLEDIPRFGNADFTLKDNKGKDVVVHGLADALRHVGKQIGDASEKELAEFYPPDSDGATPMAYLWARTIRCDSPNCGAEIPLIRSFWLCTKAGRKRALRLKVARPKNAAPLVEFEVFEPKSDKEVSEGTVARAKASCPCCGMVLPPDRVRAQLTEQRGGANVVFDTKGNRTGGARILAVVTLYPGMQGRNYRLPSRDDYVAIRKAHKQLESILDQWERGGKKGICPVPDEAIPRTELRRIALPIYGIDHFRDIFTSRQLVALATLARKIAATSMQEPINRLLALSLDKTVDLNNANTRWKPDAECPVQALARHDIGMAWDFAETVPMSRASGSFFSMYDRTADSIAPIYCGSPRTATVVSADACAHPLPDQSASVWFTDPPYYDSVPYAHLSDFFYIWMRRCLTGEKTGGLPVLTPKNEECVVDRPHKLVPNAKTAAHYEKRVGAAMAEGRRLTKPDGLACVVFAHKTTEGWEALLSGMIQGGWVITSSWPITTEMQTRLNARENASLAASVHLVCRPRLEHAPVGDWGEVVRELPNRVGNWMEKLQAEHIRGADLVFACIGPALEIYSRYSRVEDAEGREIHLGGDPEAVEPHKRGFLAYVWETVGRCALQQVLGTAEAKARNGAAGAVEEDARLTALFLWTLQSSNGDETTEEAEEDESEDDEEGASTSKRTDGYPLVFDVVRRFAQPLGIHLEDWEGRIIETKKGVVWLLSVSERAEQLFGEEGATLAAQHIEEQAKRNPQFRFGFAEEEGAVPHVRGRARRAGADRAVSDESLRARREATTLDRVHAAMLLQAAGRANALRALLKSEQDRGPEFLRLANALSALYPKDSEEKRLLDAMLLAVPR